MLLLFHEIAPLLWLMQSVPQLMMTAKQLQLYDGVRYHKVYLAVLGTVFDVTAGASHYGPRGRYHAAAGRDASRAFSTGPAPYHVLCSP